MGFFQTIVEYFERLWDFISNTFLMLSYAAHMVLAGTSSIGTLAFFMPAVIGACVLTSVAVLVIRFLLLK